MSQQPLDNSAPSAGSPRRATSGAILWTLIVITLVAVVVGAIRCVVVWQKMDATLRSLPTD